MVFEVVIALVVTGLELSNKVVTIDIEIYLWYSTVFTPKTAIFPYSTMFFCYDHQPILRLPGLFSKKLHNLYLSKEGQLDTLS